MKTSKRSDYYNIPNENNKGEKNGNWKGGVSAYPNHYKMKLARIEKFKLANGKCEICKKKANVIHHIDESKTNHNLDNLIVLCHSCHWVIHTSCEISRPPRKVDYQKYRLSGNWKRTTIDWKNEYGIKWVEISKNYGLSPYEVTKLRKKKCPSLSLSAPQ